MRLVVPPNSKANRFDVAITDTRGRRVQLGSVSLDGLPATERMSARWAQEVRVPLPFHGIDLRQVAALELIPRTGTGQAWLIDAYGWNNGMPDPRPVALPRVDVGALTVQEGDSGTKKYQIPITVTGDGPGSVRLFIGDEQNFTTQLVTLQPGQHTIEIPPIEVVGNTRWSSGSTREVLAKAVQGTVAGNYIGGLTVLNDDPEPTLTLTPIADRVTEGSVLTWRLTLSTEADSPFFRLIRPRPPTGGPELSSTDVDPEWFRQNTYGPEDPLPSRPLSTTSLLAFVVVPPGQLSADVTVPTVTDTEAEPDELVLLNLLAWPPGGREFDVVGTVTDKP
jgi:hypothetical protein